MGILFIEFIILQWYMLGLLSLHVVVTAFHAVVISLLSVHVFVLQVVLLSSSHLMVTHRLPSTPCMGAKQCQ